MSKYMITDGRLYLRRDASGNFVPVKSQPLGDVWISIHALREESDAQGDRIGKEYCHFNPRSP